MFNNDIILKSFINLTCNLCKAPEFKASMKTESSIDVE